MIKLKINKNISPPTSTLSPTPPPSVSTKLDQFISDKYAKLGEIEAILKNAGQYIGSVDVDTYKMYIVNDENNDNMIEKTLHFSPGLYKLFDEIIVNARDHYIQMNYLINKKNQIINKTIEHDPTIDIEHNHHPVKNIYIDIDRETGRITIKNDGEGIDVVIHPTQNKYVPEVIFGELSTGTNFGKLDKNNDRITGGMHGLGAKLCNIYSKEFVVETIDSYRKLFFKQIFKNNMYDVEEPIVQKCSKIPYTKISFIPDYSRFGCSGISDDLYSLFKKRVYDMAGTITAVLNGIPTNPVNIFFNNQKINIKSFERYIDMYIGSRGECKRLYQRINDDWEIAVCSSDDNKLEQLSFVNGICTYKGGKHVDHVVNNIVKGMFEFSQEHKKGYKDIKDKDIERNLCVFINCIINNPSFDGQIKETMTTPVRNFRSKCNIDTTIIEKLCNKTYGILDKATSMTKKMDNKMLKSVSATSSRKKYLDIENFNDAEYAGTAKSSKCIIILTEGNSAKASAEACLSGLPSIEDQKYYGIMPLRGKMKNPKEEKITNIVNNKEIKNLIDAIGLEFNKDYTLPQNYNKLRYGRIFLMTDADVDGDHIKGLIFNIFHEYFPTLLKRTDFFASPLTPILKATLSAGNIQNFYSEKKYIDWKNSFNDNIPKHKIKYYKGLGTSTISETKEYFKNMKLQVYNYLNCDQDNKTIMLAFSKKMADDRKKWITNYLEELKILQETGGKILEKIDALSYSEFIDLRLIKFSIYDNIRSIPCVIDGLKPSQRKILYTMMSLKKEFKIGKEIKVAQLASRVASESKYHHGEVSLTGTIIGMAQDHVGSNNINLLLPIGIFGSRNENGKDSASPRYIHTFINPISKTIFNDIDFELLVYLDEDGEMIEPEFMCPIVPLVLINGSSGIGTGWSCNVHQYNPYDIIENIYKYLNNEQLIDMIPFFRGYTGKVEKISCDSKYKISGKYSRSSPTRIDIFEIPVGSNCKSFSSYESFLKEMILKENSVLKDYSLIIRDDKINCYIEFNDSEYLNSILSDGTFENIFKLSTTFSTTNMYLFDENGIMKKYNTTNDIITDFCNYRFKMYEKRKEYLLYDKKRLIQNVEEKIRFLNYLDDVNHPLKLTKKTYKEIIELLHEYKFKQPLPPHKRKLKSEVLSNNNVYIIGSNKEICDNVTENMEESVNGDVNGGDVDGGVNDGGVNGGGVDGGVDGEEEEGMNGNNYGYLLNMSISKITKDKIEKLKNELEILLEDYNILNNKTIKDLWIEDLEKLKSELKNVKPTIIQNNIIDKPISLKLNFLNK